MSDFKFSATPRNFWHGKISRNRFLRLYIVSVTMTSKVKTESRSYVAFQNKYISSFQIWLIIKKIRTWAKSSCHTIHHQGKLDEMKSKVMKTLPIAEGIMIFQNVRTTNISNTINKLHRYF